jgi:hypothetical protein
MKVYLIVSILALVLIHPTFVRAQNCPPCYKNVPIIAGTPHVIFEILEAPKVSNSRTLH